jgi:PQQ-dependent dehydrogenase (methanol/ethanol family)
MDFFPRFDGGVMERLRLAMLPRPRRASLLITVALGALLAFAPACTRPPAQQAQDVHRSQQPPAPGQIVAPPFVPADDGQWTMPAKDYASTRFSSLDEINTTNAANLKVAWTFSTGNTRGHEAAPLVVGGTMYVVTPYPNVLYALDLTKPGAPAKWAFQPKPNASAQGVACCDLVNRGAVFSDGKIFFNTLDNQTIAVDANTGAEVWRAQLGDINRGETITMAPLVVKGKVLVGNSGGEMGVRGWLTALDAATGKIAWRAYHTGPDKDCLIGANFHPYYQKDQGTDLGVSTWSESNATSGKWQIGGGTMWGWISYDPDLDLIFYGTGNPGPWNPELRPGDNKWTCGIFARKPDTGEAVWYYQISPHDLHDYDAINEQILLDANIDGRQRKVLLRPERDGYMYLMDRATGEVLKADAYGYITASKGVDIKTGKVIENPEKAPKTGQTTREICPAAPGMKDWQPSAFSPRTGLLYVPHQNLCMDVEGLEASYIAGTPYVGMNVKMYAGPGGNRGVFSAWDPVGGREVWKIDEDLPVWSGALATAGDVVFYGTMDGWFKAVNARDGSLLWQFKCGSGIIGQPITYRAPDGKQYVAILAGVGGWAGAVVAGDLDPRDGSAALGFANAMADLKDKTTKGGMLYVFALP